MAAKNCMLVINRIDGSKRVLPEGADRLSKVEAQRMASAQITDPLVASCVVVCEVLVVNK